MREMRLAIGFYATPPPFDFRDARPARPARPSRLTRVRRGPSAIDGKMIIDDAASAFISRIIAF